MGGANPRRGADAVFLTRHQTGSALVEMALLAPFLILLLIGVAESGWLISRSIDVSHAAREAGRLASVNESDSPAIVSSTCDSMDSPAGAMITLTGATNGLGGDITATASQSVDTMTGLLDQLFSPPVNLAYTTTFRLEEAPAIWTDVMDSPCPP